MLAKKLLLNTLLLTAGALLMRAIGLWFQVFLTSRLGAAGIGLFQLVMSVQILAVTFAVSGARFTVTRLAAEEIGKNNPAGVRAAVRRCLGYALICGAAAGTLLIVFAGKIGEAWIGDARTVLSIRILGFSMPMVSAASVLGGYFTAVQRVIKSSSAQVFEQIVRIGAVMLMLSCAPEGDLEHACASVALGSVIGQAAALLLTAVLYLLDARRYGVGAGERGMTKRMLKMAVPLALSAYARTALGTLQHMLVPRGLRRSGASSEAALAAYGTISGMALPVILFPLAICTSLAEMLIPGVTEAQVAGDSALVNRISKRMLTLTLFFSVGVAGIFFAFAGELGAALYGSETCGRYIRIFAPLVTVMYMDTVTDGLLKGLGQQLHSMKYNVADALISVIMVWSLLPKYAVPAYVFTIFFTECFNFALSIMRLRKLTATGITLKKILLPLLCAAGAVNFSLIFLRFSGAPLTADGFSLALHILLSGMCYALLLRVCGCLDAGEIKAVVKLFSRGERQNKNKTLRKNK